MTNGNAVMTNQDQMIQQNDETLADHKLTVICDTKDVKCYRLGKPDTIFYSCYITFTPDGISIAGDLTPSENADYCRGYGLEWFTNQMDGSYLAQKFRLRKQWIWDKAKEEWDRLVADEDAEGQQVAGELSFETPCEYYEALCEMGWEDDPTMEWLSDTEVAWLVSIQKAFKREYGKLAQ